MTSVLDLLAEMRLKGLRRMSPCCYASVYHPADIEAENWDEIRCQQCERVVEVHLIENMLGEIVWPGIRENLPPFEPAKRSRRKPREAEPAGYRVMLPRRGK